MSSRVVCSLQVGCPVSVRQMVGRNAVPMLPIPSKGG
jgi:hypothetical protein